MDIVSLDDVVVDVLDILYGWMSFVEVYFFYCFNFWKFDYIVGVFIEDFVF